MHKSSKRIQAFFALCMLLAITLPLFFISCTSPTGHDAATLANKEAEVTGDINEVKPLPALANVTSNCSGDLPQPGGGVYRICMPNPINSWNGDLVVYAHGYATEFNALEIPDDELTLSDGTSIIELINSRGYAFAVTSFSKNGLAVREGLEDILELVDLFIAAHGKPKKVLLIGASEGGLITALAMEQYPDLFDAGLSLCGPIGNFRKQINYIGDFRVLFDYFFPGILPGDVTHVPNAQTVFDNWETVYKPAITAAINNHPEKTEQLLDVSNAATSPFDASTISETILELCRYCVFSVNDATAVLGGQPFDNQSKKYKGSEDDEHLNNAVPRYQANALAVEELQRHYQTSSTLLAPLVVMSNIPDHVVPGWHSKMYTAHIIENGSCDSYIYYPVWRYGHCNFTENEALAAFSTLVMKAER